MSIRFLDAAAGAVALSAIVAGSPLDSRGAQAQGGAAGTGTPAMALRIPPPNGTGHSPRNASYRLRARLDEKAHRVTGEGALTWRNLERQPVDKLVFHLYQNAFKNLASTFVFEAGASLRGDDMPERGYGSIDVSMLRVNGRDVWAAATVDDTLLTIPLAAPIGPSATVEVEFAWSVQLPRIFARSGWVDQFHAVTQWFPKIGVWDCDGDRGCRWRAHQYHGVTEFFADYGVYDVDINVPSSTVVGATGVRVGERVEGDRRILSYHAEDVHDFAWFADPTFVEVNDTVEDSTGRLAVRLLSRPGHLPYTPRILGAVRAAVQEADERLGPYPYSNLTVVVPPAGGNGAGGMEYPTIITSAAVPLPTGVHEYEETVAHEFGHQYFYHLFASDEVEEAWLDEGLNETFSGWAMDRLTGGRCSTLQLPYVCLSTVDRVWLVYRATNRRAAIGVPSYRMPVDSYGAVTYDHTAVMMRTLEGYLGDARLRDGMRLYADRARFRHPGRRDFVTAVSQGAHEDLSWFFDQALDTTRVLDYEVSEATSEPFALAAGYYDCPARPLADTTGSELAAADRDAQRELLRASAVAACQGKPPGRHELLPDATEVKPVTYDTRVVVGRRGEFIVPITVRGVFEDGAVEQVTWTLAEQQAHPEERRRAIRFSRRPYALKYADVDPDNRWVADENRINNAMFVRPRKRPVARLWLTWAGAISTLLDLLGT